MIPITISGGAGEAGSTFNVGGGACGFYKSISGSYSNINASLGGGGGCSRRGDAAKFGDGGDGGDGACHLWVSGSNHYEIGDDISICVMVTQLVGAAAFVFPYDINND